MLAVRVLVLCVVASMLPPSTAANTCTGASTCAISIHASNQGCTTSDGWKGSQSVELCASACSGHPYFTRNDGNDGNCKCCTTTDNIDSNLVNANGEFVYKNAADGCAADTYQTSADQSRIFASGQECTADSGWKNIQGQDSSVERCASECSAHAYFTMASGQGGDRNCKCCTDSPGPGSLQALSSMNTYLNAAHSSHSGNECTACPSGKTQTAQAFTADTDGANRYCTLKSGFSGDGNYAWRAAAASWVPTFGSPSPTTTGFTVQISNHDAAYTWAGTATASGIVAITAAAAW